MADYVQKNISIPLLHIADTTAERIKNRGLKKVGLLGTRFTMEQNFYKGRLTENHSIEVIVPAEQEREIVHRVIFDELVLGTVNLSRLRIR